MDKLANDEAFRQKFQSDAKATFAEYCMNVPDELIYYINYIKQKEKNGKSGDMYERERRIHEL